MSLTDARFDAIIDNLVGCGYSITDDFLSPALVRQLVDVFDQHYHLGNFKNAGIGKSSQAHLNTSIRGDEILWLNSEDPIPALRQFFDLNQSIINHLNATCFLGITDSEMHFAKYAAGKFYKRHRDTFSTQKGRILSIIYYLNTQWLPAHEGELIIYKEEDGVEQKISISPISGRMVCFQSEKLEHEVVATTAPRLSITGWFLNRPLHF